ncbi:SRPBCC family protein [Shivajiella indica]|uniref:SRPBCC family protein n=1 Tax=Shivajiella indica TaxID=872115 RepID=A0ABW5B892_9BACT
MSSEKITIDAIVNAEIGKVWQYYNHAQHIVNWNFASDDWCCPKVETDFRAGGKYLARMEAKDGSFGFDFEAVFDEVLEQEKVAYTMPNGRRVDIAFQEENGQTNVQIQFDPEQTHPREMQQDGWQAILNNFKKYVESQ